MGDWAGRAVAEQQPLKLAAMEGLGQTEKGARLTLGGIYDARTGKIKYGIAVPKALSLLATHNPNSTVRGLDTVPRKDQPGPINTVRYAFATMVTIGTLLALLGIFYAAVWWRRGRLPRSRWFYRAVIVAAPASVLALISGWIVTEVGRQPWIVYEVMRVEDAVTAAGGLPWVFAGVAAIYLSMTAIIVWLTRRLSQQPRPSEAAGAGEPA